MADNFSKSKWRIISLNRIWRIISHNYFVADNLAFLHGGAAKMPMSRPNSFFWSMLSPFYFGCATEIGFSNCFNACSNRDSTTVTASTMQESRFEHTIVHLRIISQNSTVGRRKCRCRVRNVFLGIFIARF